MDFFTIVVSASDGHRTALKPYSSNLDANKLTKLCLLVKFVKKSD